MKKIFAFVLVSFSAAACGGSGTSNPVTGGGHALTDGHYNYNATSAPVNSCWAAPKAVLTFPMLIGATLAVSGGTVTVTTDASGSIPSQAFSLTKNGDALDGTNDGIADLSTGTIPIDCQLAIHSTFAGTITADDAFDATIAIHVAESSGAGCATLVGTISPQLDSLPCDLTLAGNATKQ